MRDSIGTWFLDSLLLQHAGLPWYPTPGVYYEFGVGDGRSAATFASAAKEFCQRTGASLDAFHIVGFDSFRGLPPTDAAQDAHPEWTPGRFAHRSDDVRRRVAATGFPLTNLHLVEGFYEDTLTEGVREKIPQAPSVVMVDCDLYSSTVTVLRWIAPMLASGTLIYFDDIWSFHGHPAYGQIAAIRDVQDDEGFGYLTPFPSAGSAGHSYIYARATVDFDSLGN